MADVQQARIEAAARAMTQVGGDGFGVVVERDGMSILDAYTEYARAAIAAADAVVTVEMIADEIAGHPVGSGYYQTTVGTDEARGIAATVQRLYRGEEQS